MTDVLVCVQAILRSVEENLSFDQPGLLSTVTNVKVFSVGGEPSR